MNRCFWDSFACSHILLSNKFFAEVWLFPTQQTTKRRQKCENYKNILVPITKPPYLSLDL